MDYAALAKQYGGTTTAPAVDYAALAKEFGGTTSSSGVPVGRNGGEQAPERTVSGFAGNVVKSAGHLVSGLATAIAHPIDTATGLLDIAAGGLQNALPQNVVDFVNKFENNPEAAARAVKVANAVGGQYAKDYGTIEGFKTKLYTDPVGVFGDVSALFTGGGGVLTGAGKVAAKADAAVLAGLLQGEGTVAARVAEAAAPVAGKVARGGQTAQNVGAALSTAGKYTNPLTPVIAGVERTMPVAASAIGAVQDYFNPNVKAARVVKQAAGENLPAIRAANAAAPTNVTAAQAAAGSTAPTYQALAAAIAEQDIDKSLKVRQAQEAARRATIEEVTPNLAESQANLDAAAKVSYGRAMAADKQRINNLAAEQQNANMLAGTAGPIKVEYVSPALEALKGNPVIDAAAKEARTLARTKDVILKDPMTTLEGLHYMKMAIDNQFKNRGATTALNNYSDAALSATKQKLLAAIEGTANQPGVSPLYSLARKQHAALSEPVNQAKILNAMQDTLQGVAGEERANSFLNVLGKGENALLKRADQNPRFGTLEEVLTGEQMGAANKVAGELTRDIKIGKEAQEGAVALKAILDNTSSKFRIPFNLSAKTAVANKTISILEGKLSTKVLEVLKKGFESGANMEELLSAVPAKDRNKMLIALNKATTNLSPEKLNALGLTANALAPVRIQLNNMAPSSP
jgi:hypothetical protein